MREIATKLLNNGRLTKIAVLAGLILCISVVAYATWPPRPKNFFRSFDAGFYNTGSDGTRTRLLINLDQVAVCRQHDPTNARRHKDMEVISVPEPVNDKDEMEKLILKMRAEPEYVCVFPVLIAEESGLREILTDEFIVKPAGSAQSLMELNKAEGVEVIKEQEIIGKVYVLRVLKAGVWDTLRLVEEYKESGLVEWAEPNFQGEIDFDI